MYFYGSFLTQLGETVTVHIVTENSRAQQVEIGDEKSGVFFTTNPVEIESSVNDTFDHLLRSQATIRLLTRDFIQDLFCTTCMDAVVNIFKGNKCIFAGFVEPQTYSQGYNEVYDELEISCIDVLSALQYSKYRDVGGLGVLYDTVKINAGQRTIKDMLDDILNRACEHIDITGVGGVQIYYDGSKALTSAESDRYGIFSQMALSELLFLGSDEDDVWQQDKVLEVILKYLNLHIVQDGLQFYIFSWESIKSGDPISWYDLFASSYKSTDKHCITIDLSNAASTDTTISIGEVFNQILLTCKVESIESIIQSPLDTSMSFSPYENKQLYLTEISSDGEGETAYNAFYAMTHEQPTDYDCALMTDWYIQVKDNANWIFPDNLNNGYNLIDEYCRDKVNQHILPNRLAYGPGAALISFGKIEHKAANQDNSPTSKIDMTDYMVISVNGNLHDNPILTYPNEASLKANAPLAVYNGPTTGAVYSPADDQTTNYIVFSGKVVLNPFMAFTGYYKTLHDAQGWDTPEPEVWHMTVPSRSNGDGRYYTQKYYSAATPFTAPAWDESIMRGLVPYTGSGPQEYRFAYSTLGDSTDKISKIGVLGCMLIIGDKCLVETGTSGTIADFEWRTFKTREQCADDDEYYQQSFTIGFDPKIGDKLIGTEFDLQNNISYDLGIDAQGMAIPVRKNDKLSGAVRFMILGPVNSIYGEAANSVHRRPSFFSWRNLFYDTSIPLLAHVSSIYLKSFEVKIYSDNGLINNLGDNDIVYMSDTRENFVNRKDDIEFEINSALTNAECKELGVTDTVKLSTPLDLTTGTGLLSIYDHTKQQQAKPEQLYVDSYYTEYHKPRILMTQKLEDRMGIADIFNLYVHPAMPNKIFYVQGISRNLIEGYAELVIKEVWND